MTRPYRSGHCTPGNVDEQHRRCTGAYAGVVCACACHAICRHLFGFVTMTQTACLLCGALPTEDELQAQRDQTDAFDWEQYAAMGESA